MKKPIVIHPFLLALFPILTFFSFNIYLISFFDILLSLVCVLVFTILLLLLSNLLIKNNIKAGIIVSIFGFLSFSFGHVHNLINDLQIGSITIDKASYLFLIWIILFVWGAIYIIRTDKDFYILTKYLNFVSGLLIVISLIQIGAYELKPKIDWYDNSDPVNMKTNTMNTEKDTVFPNIYYIILDGYARADILEEIYHHDNSEFLNHLKNKGFYIADKSRSNYCQTSLSLSSSLNLKYLNNSVDQTNSEDNDRMSLKKMITNNHVFKYLKQFGYKIAAFNSNYDLTEIKNADNYFPFSSTYIHEFNYVFLNTTPIPYVINKLYKYLNIQEPYKYDYLSGLHQYDLHRKNILYVFDHIEDTFSIKSPAFVFIHVVSPHPPFIFGQNGQSIYPDRSYSKSDGSHFMGRKEASKAEYIDCYRNQLIFINAKIKELVNNIITKSTRPSIIILQGDHGPGSHLEWEDVENTNLKERLSILNAYYLPENGDKHLYKEVTPVNTFRIIFNHYFGMNYKLLKDESYFSTWSYPYKFIKVKMGN